MATDLVLHGGPETKLLSSDVVLGYNKREDSEGFHAHVDQPQSGQKLKKILTN